MIFKNNLIRVVKNVREMLIDRGYEAETIPNSEYTNILEYKINEFIRSEDEKTNRILDFFLTSSDTKDYVFFYKGSDKGFKISKAFFLKVEKYAKEIEGLKGLNNNFDNISFILTKTQIDKNDKILIDNFESRNSHIRIFSYTKFLHNITSHKLVPLHSLYKKSYRELLNGLMLNSINQLPYILYNDPIARHFNFREDEIVKIIRNTLGKQVVVYRVCKNSNYTNMDKSIIDNISIASDDAEKKAEASFIELNKLVKLKHPKWWKSVGHPESGVQAATYRLLVDFKIYENSDWYIEDSEWEEKSDSEKKLNTTGTVGLFLKSYFNIKRIRTKEELLSAAHLIITKERRVSDDAIESKKELQTEEVLEEESSGEESTQSEEEAEEEMNKIKWDQNLFIQFYSDSAPTKEFSKDKLRYISNLNKILGKGYISIDGNNYSTIEHYYQGQKFLPKYHKYESLNDDEKEIISNEFNKFIVGGDFDGPSSDSDPVKPVNKWGLYAKTKGGKTIMKRSGFKKFDQDNWNSDKLKIMKKGIKERFRQDIEFRKILLEIKKKNKVLFHFERTGKFWGGNRPVSLGSEYWVGENKLGEIMNTIISKNKKIKKKKIKIKIQDIKRPNPKAEFDINVVGEDGEEYGLIEEVFEGETLSESLG